MEKIQVLKTVCCAECGTTVSHRFVEVEAPYFDERSDNDPDNFYVTGASGEETHHWHQTLVCETCLAKEIEDEEF